MYASDPVDTEMEELTLTLGEGPGVDALTGGPALVADLIAADCLARWPVFARRRCTPGSVRCSGCRCRSAGVVWGAWICTRAGPAGWARSRLPARWAWGARPGPR